MKILFVTTNAQPFSGSTTQMFHLVQALVEQGHDAHLSFAADNQSSYNAALSLSGNKLFSTRRTVSLGRLSDQFMPDLIHSHIETLPEVIQLGKPIIVNYGSSESLSEKACRALLASNVKSIVCISSKGYHHVISTIPSLVKKTHLIRQSTCLSGTSGALVPAQPELDVISSSRVILNIGAVRLYKDPVTFIKSLDILAERDRRVRGVWVGPVSDRRLRAIAKLCKEKVVKEGHHHTIASVSFVGPAHDIRACLSVASVVVCSSKEYEGISGAIREAMLFGVPVVATDVGHIRELIKPNWNGLLVKKEDPIALAEAIQITLDNPSITKRQVKRAKTYVRFFFSHRRRVEAHLNLYKQIVEGVSA